MCFPTFSSTLALASLPACQVLPQYPTLLSPWRPPCPGCACCTNCVPLNQPRQCVAYLSAMSPASLPAAPCEAGERRTVQELSAPVFAVPSVTFPKLVPAPQPTPGLGGSPVKMLRGTIINTSEKVPWIIVFRSNGI
jgi:hypothetical protein